MRRVGAAAGGKKGRPMIASDDSEGSSRDSSDSEFEEQIRKMKVYCAEFVVEWTPTILGPFTSVFSTEFVVVWTLYLLSV